MKKYLKYAIGEIILVAIGILIALWVNDWNENRKNKVAENKYLIALLEDYEDNLRISVVIINRIENSLPYLISLIEQSSLEKPNISVDSLNNAISKLNSMPSYRSTDRTYNNLVGSGDLKLIQNDSLKTNLAKYYKLLYILNLVQETHEMELVQSFQPYIMEYMDFQAVKPTRNEDFKLPESVEENKILEIMGTRKFRNIVTLKWAILTDLLDLNKDLLQMRLLLIN
ncbi:MAG: hypothetical protein KDC53_12940 [Saprospiraceae bacterium]|nr:hypothetical protein [Saprospiraceae bacterium]